MRAAVAGNEEARRSVEGREKTAGGRGRGGEGGERR